MPAHGSPLRRRDPELTALHKAVKAAVVATVALAIGLALGGQTTGLYAAFGGVALLMFVDFPGGRRARLDSYLVLVLVGAVLIVLGTLASTVPWLAVTGMAVVGFALLFAGVLSSYAAAATRGALLAFVLPVTVPAGLPEIPAQLAGWAIASVVAVPAAVFFWPPPDHDALRARAADACRALGTRIAPVVDRPADSSTADATAAVTALNQQFRGSAVRPVALSTGSRAVALLIDRLQWLSAVTLQLPDPTAGPEWVLRVRSACAHVLTAVADALDARPASRQGAGSRRALTDALRELDAERRGAAAHLPLGDGARQIVAASATAEPEPRSEVPTATQAAPAREQRPATGDPPGESWSLIHELGYTTALVGEIAVPAAAADSGPLPDRLADRQAQDLSLSWLALVRRRAGQHISPQSIWLRNSVRGAIGLALAVLLVQVMDPVHGFWIVLGTLSVLRSAAMNTGTAALKATIGALGGFILGAALLLLLGTTTWHLWLLLPVTVFLASYAVDVVSFVAGQAAFTVLIVILFNLITPVGWTLGLLRIEFVALGGAVSVVCGLLLWPHGAAAQIRAAIADGYRAAAAAFTAAVAHSAGRRPTALELAADSARQATGPDPAADSARRAAALLDDAFREYLSERAGRDLPVRALIRSVNGVARVRLAAQAVLVGPPGVIGDAPVRAPSGTESSRGVGDRAALDAVQADLVGRSHATEQWFDAYAAAVQKRGTLDSRGVTTAERAVLDELEPLTSVMATPRGAARARTLWWTALFLDGLTRLQDRLAPTTTELAGREQTATTAVPGGTGAAEIGEAAPA